MKVKKAIIPAAGYGTRFLPATKTIPKEMLPIVDVPSLELIVDECIQSGITEICILLTRNKGSIPNHFDRNIELEIALKKNITDERRRLLDLINKYTDKVSFVYIRQPEMKGTGRAIELCKSFVGNEPFAVLFGDDVIYNPSKPVIGQLISAYEKTGCTIVGVQELPAEKAIKCGVVVFSEIKGRFMLLRAFKEKPTLEELPKYSKFSSLGRFVLTPDIFESIKQTKTESNGELYLPVAIEILSKSQNVYAYDFEGVRYDIGDKFGFLKANIEFGLRHGDVKTELLEYLKKLSQEEFVID
ncbi:MAG: UTP--glucose-1-phosphate uridylyltransferase [Christensenellaceae bacterium]|nr:UTP--glucose-1-phosphate uridylyltransferase [Christensenellaceae bacterium]